MTGHRTRGSAIAIGRASPDKHPDEKWAEFVAGLIVVGGEAWLPEEWEAEQRRRAAELRQVERKRARASAGKRGAIVTGSGRRSAARTATGPPIMDRRPGNPSAGASVVVRSRGTQAGSSEDLRPPLRVLPAPEPGVVRVNMSPSTFALVMDGVLERAIADGFRKYRGALAGREAP